MQRMNLPGTDLSVPRLCLGTMTFGKPVGETEAIRLTHQAIDLGYTFIDTANMYEGYARYVGSPGGVAEEILGKALKGRRAEVVLATKVGMKVGPGPEDQGLGPRHVRREIDRSLARLDCDYVDLYYMHKPDPAAPLEESIRIFDDLRVCGKIHAWGLSNFSADQVAEVLRLCDHNGWHRPVALQPPYSLLKRDIERDLLPLCVKEGLGIVPYQVLQGGALSGKYRRGAPAPEGSRQREKPEWTIELSDANFTILESLEAEARSRGRSLMEHALRSLLEMPGVVSLVVGAKRPEQLAELIEASGTG